MFKEKYDEWLQANIQQETNPRRLELLHKGLGHGTVELLRNIWYPAIGNFDHLYPEWEVRDFHSGYRYIDLAYMPGGAKGGIEIHGFGPHARDLDVRRFKDLCMRHCLLTLDEWMFLTIPYLSIQEEPKQCQQLVLSFVGKFIAMEAPEGLTWMESETVRFANRLLRPFAPMELAKHLRVSDRHARRLLHQLLDKKILAAASGEDRIRTYKLTSSLKPR